MGFTLGADPEYFLETKKTGLVVPSQGRVKGTKAEPHTLSLFSSAFKAQRDNVTVEYNIPPASTKVRFSTNVARGLELSFESIPHGKRKNIQISNRASALFNPKYLEHPETQNFGCEPDYNAWTVSENKIDRDSFPSNLRSAGGHIHIGYLDQYPQLDPMLLIKWLDLFLSIPATQIDLDVDRRRIYGKAGAFRPTPWGVEYRTPSNFWIFKPEYREWVWDVVSRCVDMTYYDEKEVEDYGLEIQKCINENNPEMFDKLQALFTLDFPKPKSASDLLFEGLDKLTAPSFASTWTTLATSGSTLQPAQVFTYQSAVVIDTQ